ncbi:MAG: bifunctional glycosyltransferase family 2/GtrA family protein [Acidobacteria bacterium]|nr:bifunctional glycosyltransferase family 2/GtrA family protein [Acidobacteriota bacterium]
MAPQTVCIIPAYNPTRELALVAAACLDSGIDHVVVVDDGSRTEAAGAFEALPDSPRAHLLRHAVNLGKGAALRTGLNYAYCRFPEARAFVTADADGQHAAADIARVAREAMEHPGELVLGAREFTGDAPFRSRAGNLATRWMVRLVAGRRLADTQTGLRAVPRELAPLLLRIPAAGYEFELDMLLAAKHSGTPIREIAIRTIYIDGNRGSHFNPLVDSMKIYFVLMRFCGIALVTAALDNLAFVAAYSLTGQILASQVAARLAAMAFNYSAARKAVFQSRQPHAGTLGKYALLVGANLWVSYGLIQLIVRTTHAPVLWAKIAAESLLFLANFALLRDFVFTGEARGTGPGGGLSQRLWGRLRKLWGEAARPAPDTAESRALDWRCPDPRAHGERRAWASRDANLEGANS